MRENRGATDEMKGEALDRIEKLVKDNGDESAMEKAFPDVAGDDQKIAEERAKFVNGLSDISRYPADAKLLLF